MKYCIFKYFFFESLKFKLVWILWKTWNIIYFNWKLHEIFAKHGLQWRIIWMLKMKTQSFSFFRFYNYKYLAETVKSFGYSFSKLYICLSKIKFAFKDPRLNPSNSGNCVNIQQYIDLLSHFKNVVIRNLIITTSSCFS